MHIVLCCATRRGLRFLQRLVDLTPDCRMTVTSFREEAHEPPFLDDICTLTQRIGGTFFEARQVSRVADDLLRQCGPVDLLLSVSWRYLIPAAFFRQARLGAFVFHDSLLPAYRGFAPTVWAIVNGETQTGVTLFEMSDDYDSGDIVDQRAVAIGPDDTIAEVMEVVTGTYLSLLEANLPRLLDGSAPRIPQDHTRATYTCRRLPEDNRIDWSQPTATIYNLIRAVTWPYPGAFTTLGGRKLTVWAARRVELARPFVGRIPGRVVAIQPGSGVVVLTGDGELLVTEVQYEDEPRVEAHHVLNSLAYTLGR